MEVAWVKFNKVKAKAKAIEAGGLGGEQGWSLPSGLFNLSPTNPHIIMLNPFHLDKQNNPPNKQTK